MDTIMGMTMELQIDYDADVKTADNDTVGQVDHVVIDPVNNTVTHVVVRKGFLFQEDRIIPVEAFDYSRGGQLWLRQDISDIKQFPKFEQTHYIAPDQEPVDAVKPGGHAMPLFYYPPAGTPWFDEPTFPEDPVALGKEMNAPGGTITLEEGTTVKSSDGEVVGDVEQIFTSGKDITHVVLSKGLFFKEKKLVPIRWIKVMGEDEIRLAVDNETVQSAPPYQG